MTENLDYKFTQQTLSTSYMPGADLGTEGASVDRIKSLPLRISRADQLAQQEKVLATKPDN